MIKNIDIRDFKYFVMGMIEFKSSCTTNPGEYYIESYDFGRELMHKLTFRIFDN